MPNQAQQIHVGIDARCLNTDHLRGMGKYVSEVLGHASNADDLRWTLFGDRPEVPFHSPSSRNIRTDIFALRGYRFHTWEQIGLPLRARLAKVAVLHCTSTTAPIWQPAATIVTVHDTLPWQSFSGDRDYAGWYLDSVIPAALRRSWGIITISEQSRHDILKLWPSLERKLYLIPHGIAESYFQAEYTRLPERLIAELAGRRYLLYFGGELERKRFDWAVRVFEQLERSDVQLLVCGFTHEDGLSARTRLPPSVQERVQFLPFIAEFDMPALYQNAVAVLYPTLYEGFGFPAVEAQAVGTPVLFSAVGSLRELCGPGAEVLPPEDLDAWVTTARRLLEQRRDSAAQNQRARLWARRFSWSASAQKHVELYRQASVRWVGDRG